MTSLLEHDDEQLASSLPRLSGDQDNVTLDEAFKRNHFCSNSVDETDLANSTEELQSKFIH